MEVPSNNPYAPPVAPVADVEATPVLPCPQVELVIQLAWISFGIGAIGGVIKISGASSPLALVSNISGVAIGLAIGYMILRWITGKLRAGRNWMRWSYTAMNILSLLLIPVFVGLYPKSILVHLSSDWFFVVRLTVATAFAIWIVALLHAPATREWFRAQHSVAR